MSVIRSEMIAYLKKYYSNKPNTQKIIFEDRIRTSKSVSKKLTKPTVKIKESDCIYPFSRSPFNRSEVCFDETYQSDGCHWNKNSSYLYDDYC